MAIDKNESADDQSYLVVGPGRTLSDGDADQMAETLLGQMPSHAFSTSPHGNLRLDVNRFSDAVKWATELHADQFRKGTGIPYVSHLLAVASLVLEGGGTEDQAIAGLLHDAIEDTDTTAIEIEQRFGKDVADMVVACSDTEVKPKPPWRDRKVAYIEHLEAVDTPRDALLVSAADKLHNSRSILSDYRRIGDELWQRFNAGKDGQLWYYSELAAAFRRLIPENPITKELCLTVDTLKHEAASSEGVEQAGEPGPRKWLFGSQLEEMIKARDSED